MRVQRASSIYNWLNDSSDRISNTHMCGQPPLVHGCASGRDRLFLARNRYIIH